VDNAVNIQGSKRETAETVETLAPQPTEPLREERGAKDNANATKPGLLGGLLGGLGGGLDYILTLGAKDPSNPGLLGTLLGGIGGAVDNAANGIGGGSPLATTTEEPAERKREAIEEEKGFVHVLRKRSADEGENVIAHLSTTTTEPPPSSSGSGWGILSGALGTLGGGLDYVLTAGYYGPKQKGVLGRLLGGVGNALDTSLVDPLANNLHEGISNGVALGGGGEDEKKRSLLPQGSNFLNEITS
jgi:hypothetical protein